MEKNSAHRQYSRFHMLGPLIAIFVLIIGSLGLSSNLARLGIKCPSTFIINQTEPSQKILPSQQIRSRVNYRQIMMDTSEVDMLLKYIVGVDKYIEWGSGGSTYNFPQFVQKRFVSIEHDKSWCQNVTQSTKHNRVEMRCIPARDGQWRFGNRSDPDGRYPNFRNYVDEIDNVGEPIWDFALVDGRARVDVAIKLMSYLSPKSTIALHDGLRIRTIYREIMKYYKIIDAATGKNLRAVLILKRRKEYDHLEGEHSKVQAILDKRNKNVI